MYCLESIHPATPLLCACVLKLGQARHKVTHQSKYILGLPKVLSAPILRGIFHSATFE
ncbi:hypothetical protein NSPZN2_30170 [Nitrospira defluvii]|uniref:Uncharacterized protein n=1 Tax=Nitrospira defluvii TaxID=330214 RepID=A0ABM8RG47_9BACT|nr:hypothetical protein NSPZN2_30170 [Nitrospira defluvii]